jgi:hypothetical protein
LRLSPASEATNGSASWRTGSCFSIFITRFHVAVEVKNGRQPAAAFRSQSKELLSLANSVSICPVVALRYFAASEIRSNRGMTRGRLFGPSITGAIRTLTSNPVIDAGFQHVERQTSSTEDFIMEGSDVEARTKLLLCAIAEIENLELTDLVAEALRRPCNIPVNFSLDRRLVRGAAFAEVGHRPFASPTFGVNARVDD